MEAKGLRPKGQRPAVGLMEQMWLAEKQAGSELVLDSPVKTATYNKLPHRQTLSLPAESILDCFAMNGFRRRTHVQANSKMKMKSLIISTTQQAEYRAN